MHASFYAYTLQDDRVNMMLKHVFRIMPDDPRSGIRYMQGMGGHVDTLGYCLMHLTLNRDDTWNQERSEFVLDM